MAPVLLIILFVYLRKHLQTKTTMPKWHRVFFTGLMLAIAFLMASITFRKGKPYILWGSELLLLAVIYFLFIRKEFQQARLVIYAILPMALLEIIDHFASTFYPSFYSRWESYFDIASICTLVWLITTLIISNRQHKALMKERERTLQIEKEAKLVEQMKAALEVQVAERTKELVGQKQELQKALEDLKAAQLQLVQNEKMASLGELTAGIAHEIQNPLNFVNNFSEVNKELLAEMKEAIEKGDYEEAKALAADISGNQDKINFHGKRADGIVKGMLQHSRASTGQKELTDINALADEYLRLAYHGLRAKDKTFNAKFETDLDNSIGKINIVPQDIGRVILNLINNAFYAVSERKAALANSGQPYEPTVKVITKKMEGKVKVTVEDNGGGIPQHIVDKIFQPFFTTKPTGKGTGLGLSLSYDIVKAHGGELAVSTIAGSETAFDIILPL